VLIDRLRRHALVQAVHGGAKARAKAVERRGRRGSVDARACGRGARAQDHRKCGDECDDNDPAGDRAAAVRWTNVQGTPLAGDGETRS
jgi:hypothetical protein